MTEEVTLNGEPTFRRRKIFNVMIRFLCPFFAAIILISSIANAFGWISHVNEHIKSKKPHRPPRKGRADVVFFRLEWI